MNLRICSNMCIVSIICIMYGFHGSNNCAMDHNRTKEFLTLSFSTLKDALAKMQNSFPYQHPYTVMDLTTRNKHNRSFNYVSKFKANQK